MDPKKYFNQILAIEQMAKEEAIQLLKNNPSGRYIEFDCDTEEGNDLYCENQFQAVTGDDDMILIGAVGLNEEDHLVFKADTCNGFEYNDGEWFEFDEWTNPYAEVYMFVASNLKYAKKEP